jgi:hypothetical protein
LFETVHTEVVDELRATVKPELLEEIGVKSGAVINLFEIEPKVVVWFALTTVKINVVALVL